MTTENSDQERQRIIDGKPSIRHEKEIESLKAELEQQKLNNKHNLSIDQEVSDEIVRLKAELELSQKSVKILTDALSFYSSVRNWELASDPQGNQAKCIIDPVDHEELEDNWGDVEWIGGKRARAALAKMEAR